MLMDRGPFAFFIALCASLWVLKAVTNYQTDLSCRLFGISPCLRSGENALTITPPIPLGRFRGKFFLHSLMLRFARSLGPLRCVPSNCPHYTHAAIWHQLRFCIEWRSFDFCVMTSCYATINFAYRINIYTLQRLR